jgi:hypothetical protein
VGSRSLGQILMRIPGIGDALVLYLLYRLADPETSRETAERIKTMSERYQALLDTATLKEKR